MLLTCNPFIVAFKKEKKCKSFITFSQDCSCSFSLSLRCVNTKPDSIMISLYIEYVARIETLLRKKRRIQGLSDTILGGIDQSLIFTDSLNARKDL